MISLIEFVSICGVATMTAAGASQGLHFLRRSRADQPNSKHTPLQEDCSGRPAPGAWHEPRFGKRHSVTCRIEYVVDDVRYEGMLVDMSKRGWRARGVSSLPKGTAMQVQIICSDSPHCITIEEAVVRWTDGLEFGVEVTRISPDAAERLSDYLSARYPPDTQAPAYAFSPFSYN